MPWWRLNGLIAPTPKPIIDKISKDVAEIIKQRAVREAGEIAPWTPVIRAANVKTN